MGDIDRISPFNCERNDRKMTDIQDLWAYACNGDIENLKRYYDEGGSVDNRYFRFGTAHSLIMGAFRNNQFETVDYLISVGESITPQERKELSTDVKRFQLMEKLVEQEENQQIPSETQSI